MQCKREAGGALARRKKIKAKGDELSFAGGWSSKGKGLGIGPEQGMMESGERRRGKSLQPENVGTVRVGDRLERNFTDWKRPDGQRNCNLQCSSGLLPLFFSAGLSGLELYQQLHLATCQASDGFGRNRKFRLTKPNCLCKLGGEI